MARKVYKGKQVPQNKKVGRKQKKLKTSGAKKGGMY